MALEIIDVVPGTGIGGSRYGLIDTNDFVPSVAQVVTPWGMRPHAIPYLCLEGPSYAGEVVPQVGPGTAFWDCSPGEVLNTVPQFGAPVPLVDPFPLGSHLKSPRFGYAHHGIYAGQGMMVHFAGDFAKDLASARVRYGTLDDFRGGHSVTVVSYAGQATYAPLDVVQRALSLLNQGGYHLLQRNCEHLARWCVTGRWESPQVQRGAVGLGTLLAVGLLILL